MEEAAARTSTRFFMLSKKRLCRHPDDEQESRRSHCEHYERPEMMIVSMSAQGAFLVHAESIKDSGSAIAMFNVELSVRLRTPEIWAFDWSDTHIVEGTSKNSDCE